MASGGTLSEVLKGGRSGYKNVVLRLFIKISCLGFCGSWSDEEKLRDNIQIFLGNLSEPCCVSFQKRSSKTDRVNVPSLPS
jgi:hypothetical protein